MNKRLIKKLENATDTWCQKNYIPYPDKHYHNEWNEKFAELIVRKCIEQVEQAKNSPFVSLDDAKRMAHFVAVSKKQIEKHFGVEK